MTKQETLTMIKDELAMEHYRTPMWSLLTDSQQANLVDLVAMQYAIDQVNANHEAVMSKVF